MAMSYLVSSIFCGHCVSALAIYLRFLMRSPSLCSDHMAGEALGLTLANGSLGTMNTCIVVPCACSILFINLFIFLSTDLSGSSVTGA